MKKLLFLLAVIVACTAPAIALPLDKYTISRKGLPAEAIKTLDTHFPKAKISMIKVDRHLLKKTDYDVKLTNGTKIEFSNKGKWTSVECKKGEVPASLLLKAITRHVAKNYPDAKIRKVKKKVSGYEIGLSDNNELKYDLLGSFKGHLSKVEINNETEDEVTDEATDEAQAITDDCADDSADAA